MRSIVNVLMVTAAVVVGVSTLFAATIHVPSDQPTIQAGINAAVNGDTVLVAPGVYIENINFLGKRIVLRGTYGLDSTILRPTAPDNPIVTFANAEDRATKVTGFTFKGNLGGASAVRVDGASPTIENCFFYGLRSSYIGGVSIANGSPLVQRSLFFKDTLWGTIYAEPAAYNCAVINNTIDGCGTTARGLYVYGDNDTAFNNIVVNCTDLGFHNTGNPTSVCGYDNIWNNNPDYCCGGTIGVSDISVNPFFRDPANGDYRLADTSLCIDAGNPLADFNDPDGSRNDIGAIPYIALARSLYVPSEFATLQEAVNSAQSNDTIVIEPGTYQGPGFSDVSIISKVLSIRSHSEANQAVLNGQISLSAANISFQGISVDSVNCDEAHFTLSNCNVRGLIQVTNNGGLSAFNSDFTGASFRGYLFNWGGCSFDSCDLSQFSATFDGYSGYPTFDHCNLYGSSIITFGTCSISACTVVGTHLAAGRDGQYGYNPGNFNFFNSSFTKCYIVTTDWTCLLQALDCRFDSSTVDGGGTMELESCVFTDSESGHGHTITYNNCQFHGWSGLGWGWLLEPSLYNIQGCTFTNCSTLVISAGNRGVANIRSNTFVDGVGDAIAVGFSALWEPVTLEQNIISGYTGVGVRFQEEWYTSDSTRLSMSCNNIFDNSAGNYGDMADQTGVNGNFTSNPRFCNISGGDFQIAVGSPCAPANNSCGALIGALGVGCSGVPEVQQFAVQGEAQLNVINNMPSFEWQFFSPVAATQDTFLIAVGTDNDWLFAEKWNPAPVASSDTFVTYGGSVLVDGATYYLRLRVHNGLAWSEWYQTSFRMNSVPTVPVQRAPIDLAAVSTSTPTLWVLNAADAENDPLTYDFAGFHDTDCVAGPAIDLTGVASGIDSTGGQITELLAENCRYWWMARSFDGFEYSDWTPYAQFMVNGAPEAPSAPTLDSPPLPDNLPVFTLLPTLTWQPSFDPDPSDTVRYKLELSVTSNFSFVLPADSLLATSWTVTDSLTFGTHYWWRVTARDKTGLSAMSAVKDFWTWELGDINHSHGVDLSDMSLLIAYLTQGVQISPRLVGDLTGDCKVDISDLSTMIAYMKGTGVTFNVGCE